MLYKCNFPLCTYETSNRSKIDKHHILPRSLGGSDKGFNLLNVCPNHHRLLYVNECEQGMHSIKHSDSIEIINIYGSTQGMVMHYFDFKENKEFAYHMNDKIKSEW